MLLNSSCEITPESNKSFAFFNSLTTLEQFSTPLSGFENVKDQVGIENNRPFIGSKFPVFVLLTNFQPSFSYY